MDAVSWQAGSLPGCNALKTPYSDGTTHVLFEPLDFIARLAALVPRPRVNLTRFHGVFALGLEQPSALQCRHVRTKMGV